MKAKLIRRIMGSLLVGVASVTMLAATASGQGTEGGRLEGTWDTQVSIINCQTRDVITTFPSLVIFMAGGTMIESTSGIPQALKTPGEGVWRHTAANTYLIRFKSFNFNAMNVFTGWTIIQHEVRLDSTGNASTSSGTAEIYNPSGLLIASGCSTAVGTRFGF
jgi:hypothetical protein